MSSHDPYNPPGPPRRLGPLAALLLAALALLTVPSGANAQQLSIDAPPTAPIERDGNIYGRLSYKVTLSPASVQEVTVDYADTQTGTATLGTDYTGITPLTSSGNIPSPRPRSPPPAR